MTRSTLRLLAALAGGLAVLLLAATPAGAHGGPGQVEVTSTSRDGDQVTLTVHLKYVEDGHGVPDATVTAVVDDGTPVPMEDGAEEGDYTVTVRAAEEATIRVTSVEPATSLELPAPSADETPTTTSEPTGSTTASTEAETTTTSTEATDESGEEPATTEAAAAPTDDAEGGDGGGSSSGLIIGAVVAIVAAAGVVAALVLRKKPADT